MKVTIKDVAKEANVATSTVSRVLSNSPKISEKTKEKVHEAIKKLNYKPNAIARSLANNKTRILGVVLPEDADDILNNPFFINAMKGMSMYAQKKNYYITYKFSKTQQIERKHLKDIINSNLVDGVILLRVSEDDKNTTYLRSIDFPFVVVGRPDNPEEVLWVNNDNIDLSSKVSTKDIVLDKTITNVDNTPVNAKYATAGLGSTVEFKLEANVPGSATSKLKKYAIADKMDAGLSFNKNSVKVYYTADASSLNDADLVDATDYTVDVPFTAKGTEYTFAVNFKADTDGYVKNIYDADKKMVVVFNATVNDNATVGKTSNDNKISLDYANDDTEIVEPGPTVQVFAFNLQVVKEDNGGQKLAGAKFDLFKADKTTKIATATSDDNGLVQFTNSGKEIQLAAGTYYVKETAAPEGYVLPTGDAAWTEIKVTPTITQKTSVGANDAQYELTGLTNAGDNTFAFVTKTVKNVKITVPKTGGMGTTLFTICGASLIVLAGVMFVVLKRKKTSK